MYNPLLVFAAAAAICTILFGSSEVTGTYPIDLTPTAPAVPPGAGAIIANYPPCAVGFCFPYSNTTYTVIIIIVIKLTVHYLFSKYVVATFRSCVPMRRIYSVSAVETIEAMSARAKYSRAMMLIT